MGNSGLKGLPAAVVLGIAVVTGGCAAPPAVQPTATEPTPAAQGMPPGSVGTSAIPESFRQAIDEFPESLPEGVSWSNAPSHWRSDDDAVIEGSVAEVGIAEYWLCTWMGDYIGAVDSDDQPRADHAMSQLEKYRSLPAVLANSPSPEIFGSSVLRPARMGDTRLLREFFTSCRSLSVAADGAPTLTKMTPRPSVAAG